MNRPLSPLGRLDDASLIKTDALIDGAWVASAARFAVDDPATGERLADVANLGAAEADAAIAAAARAWPAWRSSRLRMLPCWQPSGRARSTARTCVRLRRLPRCRFCW